MNASPFVERCLPRGTDSSFAHVSDVLPKLGITKRRLKQVESICLVREQRATGCQELAFNARPFVLCGFPLRQPPKDQLTHSRHSGKFFLQILGHPQFGLPFGQDRLIPIWIATLALQQKSRIVRFQTASEMLSFFGLQLDGFHYRRMVDGFKRIFAATIFFGTEDHPAGRSVIGWHRFHFLDHMKLWFNPGEQNHDEQGQGNVITLSEAFYDEIDRHRIPVERRVVSALAHAPGVLDLYVWLVWKSWAISGPPARIPIPGPGGLNEQLGVAEYSLDRRLRHKILTWLSRVKLFWPQCPAYLSKDRRFLVVHSSRKSPAIRSASG
ncbi:MAG TPA: replication protein RepA [Terriglobia bacterium]|nr:replication protein RepA [Terriglobia bacterium]